MTLCHSLCPCHHLFSYFGESGSSFSTMPAVYCPGDLPPVNVIHTAVLPENCLHASEVIENKQFEGKTEKNRSGGPQAPGPCSCRSPAGHHKASVLLAAISFSEMRPLKAEQTESSPHVLTTHSPNTQIVKWAEL